MAPARGSRSWDPAGSSRRDAGTLIPPGPGPGARGCGRRSPRPPSQGLCCHLSALPGRTAWPRGMHSSAPAPGEAQPDPGPGPGRRGGTARPPTPVPAPGITKLLLLKVSPCSHTLTPLCQQGQPSLAPAQRNSMEPARRLFCFCTPHAPHQPPVPLVPHISCSPNHLTCMPHLPHTRCIPTSTSPTCPLFPSCPSCPMSATLLLPLPALLWQYPQDSHAWPTFPMQ